MVTHSSKLMDMIIPDGIGAKIFMQKLVLCSTSYKDPVGRGNLTFYEIKSLLNPTPSKPCLLVMSD